MFVIRPTNYLLNHQISLLNAESAHSQFVQWKHEAVLGISIKLSILVEARISMKLCQWCPHLIHAKRGFWIGHKNQIRVFQQFSKSYSDCVSTAIRFRKWTLKLRPCYKKKQTKLVNVQAFGNGATIFSSQYPSDQMQIWKFVLEVFFFLVSMCTVLIFRQPPMYQSRTPSRQRGSGRATLASAASTGTDVFWWSYSPRWMPLLLP